MIEVAFLNVANADSVVVSSAKLKGSVIDIPKPRRVLNWFDQRKCTHIEYIFLTHNHSDHAPPLPNLVNFMAKWLKSGTIKHLILPRAYLEMAFAKARNTGQKGADSHKHALDTIETMVDRQQLIIVPAEQGIATPTVDDISFEIMYPSVLDIGWVKGGENALSLVLKLRHGTFSMLLPADIDGIGLSKLLKRNKNLDSKVVKIPHHGAWTKHSENNWRELMDNSDPEFAILSVGSSNTYKHVKPKLFQELWSRQQNSDLRLKKFVCTEVTRTCVFAAKTRTQMGKTGLSKRRLCGGDIIIVANKDGNWTFQNEQEHLARLKNVEMPACLGKANL
ncbi:MAG: hypothetical protein GY805_27415 [Chloroflexi bacterium]|nr:hypothetical protein [Chloroflexota bacterium]